MLKPRRLLLRLALGSAQRVDFLAEPDIGGQQLDLGFRGSTQDGPGIVREIPKDRIEAPPQLITGVIPRPAQIERQLGEHSESFDLRRERSEKTAARLCLVAHLGDRSDAK